MKTIPLGPTDLQVTRLCYGGMRLSSSWDPKDADEAMIKRGIKMLESAVEAGFTFIDHADIYGGTACEMIHGRALDVHPEWREKLVVATKCGIRGKDDPKGAPHRYDFSGEYIRQSAEGSLKRLKLERIDLYQLHRPDWRMDPEEVASAFVDLHKAGKVRYFGVSNFKPSQVRALQSAPLPARFQPGGDSFPAPGDFRGWHTRSMPGNQDVAPRLVTGRGRKTRRRAR
jgi:predicted oxidoreductase